MCTEAKGATAFELATVMLAVELGPKYGKLNGHLCQEMELKIRQIISTAKIYSLLTRTCFLKENSDELSIFGNFNIREIFSENI